MITHELVATIGMYFKAFGMVEKISCNYSIVPIIEEWFVKHVLANGYLLELRVLG
jgi:hypothetical protein